jgi:hypothetical protein
MFALISMAVMAFSDIDYPTYLYVLLTLSVLAD